MPTHRQIHSVHEHFDRDAVFLLKDIRRGDEGAISRYREAVPKSRRQTGKEISSIIQLDNARYAIARELGYDNWDAFIDQEYGIVNHSFVIQSSEKMWIQANRIASVIGLHQQTEADALWTSRIADLFNAYDDEYQDGVLPEGAVRYIPRNASRDISQIHTVIHRIAEKIRPGHDRLREWAAIYSIMHEYRVLLSGTAIEDEPTCATLPRRKLISRINQVMKWLQRDYRTTEGDIAKFMPSIWEWYRPMTPRQTTEGGRDALKMLKIIEAGGVSD